jgi:eukaryotic translation initiation factor 2C
MVLERIRAWQTKNNGNLPHNIMYFRDGVSASQYNSLLTYELAHIYEACRVAQITDPKVTIIVTTKRHHVRFYPLIANTERNDRGKNCPAGTLVDQAVTNPWYNDFFLQAQSASGVKGTARPTHYFVLKDDMGWEIRNLQNFINKLCYTYMRSVTSVSYATPAYYADRLCDRLRFYFKHFFEPLHKSKSPNEKAQPHDFRAEWDRLAHLHQDTTRKNPWHPNLDNTMFFL